MPGSTAFKNITFALTSTFALLASTNLQAGCDTCIQAAAVAASTSIQTGLTTVGAGVQANVTATTALSSVIAATTTSLQATLKLNSQQLLDGIDAAANRVVLAAEQNTKVSTQMTDHTINSLVTALKQAHIAETVDANDRVYSEGKSQPLAGDIGANRAPLLKQGMVQAAQVWRKMAEDMHEWSNESMKPGEEGEGRLIAVLLTEEEDVWNPVPLITKRQLTKEESINMQKLITMLVNPIPLEAATEEQMGEDQKAMGYELKRKLVNAKLGLAHSVLAKSIADKQPLIPMSEDDWQQGYVTAEPDEDGNVSLMSMLESETVGRLGSEGWYLDVKTKSSAGILREQVYLQAVNNQLLLRMVEQEEQKLSMLALMAISALEESRPMPPGDI